MTHELHFADIIITNIPRLLPLFSGKLYEQHADGADLSFFTVTRVIRLHIFRIWVT